MEGDTVLQDLPDMQAEEAKKKRETSVTTHIFSPQKVTQVSTERCLKLKMYPRLAKHSTAPKPLTQK